MIVLYCLQMVTIPGASRYVGPDAQLTEGDYALTLELVAEDDFGHWDRNGSA
jgi:hypothetical protein